MHLLRLVALVVSIFAWQGAANAQSLTPRQNEILRTVMSAEGYLTLQMHEEFWREAPIKTWSQEHLQQFQRLISQLMPLIVRYQRAAWASARQSYAARRPVRIPGLDALEAELRDSLPSPHNAQFEASFASTRRLLAAAADRTALEIPNGRMFVTPDLIDRVETGLEASLSRVRRLAAIRYDDTPLSRKYSALGATVLSADPLVLRHELLELPTVANKVRLTSGEWTINESETAMIGSLVLPVPVSGQARIERILRAAIQGAKQSVQLQHATSAWERWRSNTSLLMEGWTVAQGARVAVSARAAYIESSGRLVLFLAIGPDASSAGGRRATVELSTHLDE